MVCFNCSALLSIHEESTGCRALNLLTTLAIHAKSRNLKRVGDGASSNLDILASIAKEAGASADELVALRSTADTFAILANDFSSFAENTRVSGVLDMITKRLLLRSGTRAATS